MPEPDTNLALNEVGFASLRTIVQRRRREMRRRMLGIHKGSGYALRAGQRVRLSPQEVVRLKRLGRMMAKKATHQLLMQRGGRRAIAMLGRRRPVSPLHKKKLMASTAARMSNEYIGRALAEVAAGNMDDALRLIMRDPRTAESPIWQLADKIYNEHRNKHSMQDGSPIFFDVEVVDEELIVIYADRVESVEEVRSYVQPFGEAVIVAKANDPISDSEIAETHIVALVPHEEVLRQHEATTTTVVAGFRDNAGTPAGYNGAGQMPKFTGPTDRASKEMPDDQAHLRKSKKLSQVPRGATVVAPPPE